MISDILALILSAYSSFYLFLASSVGSYGLAAILLSILVSSLMTYPLRWAGKIALKQQNIQAVLTPQIALIKKESHGALQHARIHALYSRYSYHPIYAVRLITGLFIQLPFLILSFFMFEGLDEISGKSFLFLGDLGKPDGLLYANGNLMPFLMTAINLCAALFVTNFSRRDLIQATFISLLFFALLYNAKSILLLFWTTNNAILLFRNVSSYRKSEDEARFNIRHYWLGLLLFLQRKEVTIFVLIFFFCMQLLLFVFTESFNEVLTKALYIATVIAFIGLALVHASFYYQGIWLKAYRINSKKTFNIPAISICDIAAILIPLALITQYALLNHDLLSVKEQLQFVAIGAAFLSIIIWLIPLILERITPTVGILPLSLTLVTLYSSMPTFIIMSSWVENPDVALLAMAFVVVFGVFFALYAKHRQMFRALSVVFFTVSTAYAAYKVYATSDGTDANPYLENISSIDFSNFIPKTPMKKRPDVYLLTYDAYVGQETMQQYGIDNSAQEQFLRRQGFKIYPNAYSIGWDSVATMSRVLEMSDEIQRVRLLSMAGNALVPAIFSREGYKTYGVLDSYFLMNRVGYDFSFPVMPQEQSVGLTSLIKGLKEGQFRFDLLSEPANYTYQEWLNVKRSILSAKTDYPKFMYTHSGPGHSQNSGTCLPNETELFERRLDIANEEMVVDIETVIATSRDSIIIVNGDHGPALTGDCAKLKNLSSFREANRLHLQDRVGTFLAIRWPDDSYDRYDDIRTLQDTFEAVFKYLFETEEVLQQRPGTSTIKHGIFPKGTVKDGMITVGSDQGRSLFESSAD